MWRKIIIIAVITLALSIFAFSSPVIAQSDSTIILPLNCRVMAGEKMSLGIDGSLPSTAVVTWDVDYGGIVSVLPGSSAVLVAPYERTVITVYATIWHARSGRETTLTRQCIVTPTDTFSG